MLRRIGLIVNPVAGLGGRVALKGTDGLPTAIEALARGAVPQAQARTRRALAELRYLRAEIGLMTPAGAMGEDAARAEGFEPTVLDGRSVQSTAADTIDAARRMAALDAELIVFAGGDGTARDIHGAIGRSVPILGIPAGVKMQSGVFATGPAAAGRLAARFMEPDLPTDAGLVEAEIMDIDEDALRAGRVSARLHGYARVPHERGLLQQAKAGPRVDDDEDVAAAARGFAREMLPGTYYVVGPGRGAKQVLTALGLEGTLLGVDVVRDRKLIAADVAEADLSALDPVAIVTGVTGGQGFLFGRGNQQIGPDVIRGAGREGICIIAGRRKLAGLSRLLCDTGDPALDRELAGYARVRCGANRWMMMKIEAA